MVIKCYATVPESESEKVYELLNSLFSSRLKALELELKYRPFYNSIFILNIILYIMKNLILIAIFCGITLSEDVSREENVKVLNQNNFSQTVDNNKYILVEFCKYCFANIHSMFFIIRFSCLKF